MEINNLEKNNKREDAKKLFGDNVGKGNKYSNGYRN